MTLRAAGHMKMSLPYRLVRSSKTWCVTFPSYPTSWTPDIQRKGLTIVTAPHTTQHTTLPLYSAIITFQTMHYSHRHNNRPIVWRRNHDFPLIFMDTDNFSLHHSINTNTTTDRGYLDWAWAWRKMARDGPPPTLCMQWVTVT